MREEFEKLPEIAELLIGNIWIFEEKINQYLCDDLNIEDRLNLAWYAYQEQQKKIDMQECGAKDIISIINSIIPYEYDLDTMSKINKIKELLK